MPRPARRRHGGRGADEGQIENAKKQLEAAQQKAADANGAVDKLRAEAEAFKAQAELSKSCLLGTVGALEQEN